MTPWRFIQSGKDLFPFHSLKMHARKKKRGGTAKGDRKQITAVRLLPPHAKSHSVIFPAAKPPRQAFPRLFRPTLTRHFPFYSKESFVSRKPLSKRLSTSRNTYYTMWPRRAVKSRGKVNISSLWNFPTWRTWRSLLQANSRLEIRCSFRRTITKLSRTPGSPARSSRWITRDAWILARLN